ncbi:MAG TPA: AMP-binding protein [Actinomycetota bacterium]|nr:AMP-binding protein [Actinomycetota bacterium]
MKIDELQQVGKVLSPQVLGRLWEAGAFDPRAAMGAVRSLPWLVGRGPSLGVLAQINATAYGDRAAVHDSKGSLSWKELDGRTNRLARALEASGVRSGDRVATLLRNGREAIEAIYASHKLGVAVAPLNTWGRTRELKHAVEQSKPTVLVYDVRHASALRPAVGDDIRLVAVEAGKDALDGSVDYESFLEDQSDGPLRPVSLDRSPPKILIHTSGTTGKAKAASRGTPLGAILSLLGLFSIVPYRRSDVILCPPPLFHAFGLLTFTLAGLLGAPLVLPEKFDPEETLTLIDRHDVTAMSLVPVMVRRILDLPDEVKSKFDLDTLRIILVSGSVLPDEVRGEAMAMFGEIVYDLYGSTEAGWVAVATPEDMQEAPGTVGKPVPGVDVAAFGEDRTKQAPREKGTLAVKSGMVFEGYASGEDTETFDGYLSIGDSGWVDEEGRLFVEGRTDEMVVIGGENVYPVEVESVIEGMDGVRDVAVVGIPDQEYGQVLAAFVEGSVDQEQVVKYSRDNLASFKVPKVVEVVDELPRTSTGKVRKNQLLEKRDRGKKRNGEQGGSNPKGKTKSKAKSSSAAKSTQGARRDGKKQSDAG